MEKMTAVLPFTHATPAVQQIPAPNVHVEPHIHMAEQPAPEVNLAEGAVTVYPPDVHVHAPDVKVEPAQISITLPNGEKRPAEAITEKLADGRVRVSYVYEESS